jgi:hypothetical protein
MASPRGSPSLLQQFNTQKCCLTASLSVSCYGGSAGRIALVGRAPVKMGRLKRMNALLLGLESFC